MKREQNPPGLGPIVTALAVSASGVSIALSLLDWESKVPLRASAVIMALVGLAASIYYLWFSARRYPSSIVVSLVGPPGVGKTTYLTMLFRELERGQVGSLVFAPAGKFTTELVAKNITTMASGCFPERTSLGPPTNYEAVARVGSFFGRQYRLRIADFAGEYLYRVQEGSPWFHETEFFNLLAQSDAIFFMVDCESIIAASDFTELVSLERSFIAALNLVAEQRNEADPTARLDIPVALLFSKADAIWDSAKGGEQVVLKQMDDLISVCMRRCRRFRYFFLSSLGRPPLEGNIPPKLCSPRGIVEPISWLLRR